MIPVPIGLALVGCGDVAMSRHLPAIAADERVRLVATCDIDLARANDAARSVAGAHPTDRLGDILDDPEVTALVVATPPWASPKITIAAVEAGRHVLTEKPMAVTIEEALAIAAASRTTGRIVQVGFTFRHDPLIVRLHDWVAAGRLGRPVLIRLGVFDETWDPTGAPEHLERMLSTLRHGPPAIHDGAHSADQLNLLTDSHAIRVHAAGMSSRPEFAAPNYNVAWIEFENGDRATLEIGWLYPRLPDGEFEILGPLGIAWLDRRRKETCLSTASGSERLVLDDDYFATAFRLQLSEFATSIIEQRPARPGPAEGIASLALTKAIERALTSGDWEAVDHWRIA